jgi:hypothetical protein
MHRTLSILLIVLCLQGCSDNTESLRQVHTSFTESSGLTVIDHNGKSQQLIGESLGVKVVVSPSTKWILVEDMQLSNLVVIRAFRLTKQGYQEVLLPEMKHQWEAFAQQAGVNMEDLIHPRVGIEEFGPHENTVSLRFRADVGTAGNDMVSVIEISLDQAIERRTDHQSLSETL